MRTKFPVPIAVAWTEFQNSVEVLDNAITGVSSTAMTRNLPLPYHCQRTVLTDDQCSHDSNTIACVVRRTEPESRGTTAVRKNELPNKILFLHHIETTMELPPRSLGLQRIF